MTVVLLKTESPTKIEINIFVCLCLRIGQPVCVWRGSGGGGIERHLLNTLM